MTSLITRDINHFFNSLFPDFPLDRLRSDYEGYPVTSVFVDKNGNYKLEVAVSGFNKDEVNVLAENGCLIIEGKKEEKDGNEWEFVHGKLKHTSFSKRFSISNRLDVNKSEVQLENGVLTIIIPAKEETKPKQLKISYKE